MDNHINNAKSTLKRNGKSFYWAGKFLSEENINRAAELYSFCRALDDIADSGDPSSLKCLKGIKFNLNNNLYSSANAIETTPRLWPINLDLNFPVCISQTPKFLFFVSSFNNSKI